MPTLRDIRRRQNAVKNIAKITQAMKMVSAAKLKRAQRMVESARPYVTKVEDMLSNIISNVGDDYTHPLIQIHKEIKSIAIIVIGSDRGQCGSFNNNLFRMVSNYIKTKLPEEYPGASVTIIPVGNKSCSFFRKSGWNVLQEYHKAFTPLNFSTAKDIVNQITTKYETQEFDRVLVYYNEFLNLLRQIPKAQTVLPVEAKPIIEKQKQLSKYNALYIYEPDQPSILDELIPKLVDIKVWRSMLESNAAEQAARMMAMDNATTNANELIVHLDLVFNKLRQATITKEMLDIVTGAEALQKG
jgi:F-type H+-transporting ATPase subunit gamma